MVAVAAVEPLIHGEGTPEVQWRAWQALASGPVVDLDALVPSDARLVVVAPHPDDELLACGGMMAMHADRGGELLLIRVTDGEASHLGVGGGPGGSLATRRRREGEAGLRALLDSGRVIRDGIEQRRLALPDGDLRGQQVNLTNSLQARLRASDRVVTTWRDDGHPDHEATGVACIEACAAVGCRLLQAPVWMWHWAVPDDERVPWQRLCRLVLSEAIVARKANGLDAHRSQWEDRGSGLGPVLPASTRIRALRPAEYFLV